ncbi:MAG: cellobiose phosphorylase, partial [Sphingomonadales bacterium]|nr:cellobiose phosphorylase [Sphingomonadales bacterium]
LDLAPGADVGVVFALGQGETHARALDLIRRWKDPAETQRAWTESRAAWADRLGRLVVKTPDPAFDLMVNRWLPCQTLNARVRARAGYYQAGGAFGFRDQLQDILALIFADPRTARAHILVAAAHQFEEGDVLHWWHPPSGRGVRTRCSDDLLWLPYVVAAYVQATGDATILEETVPFLSGPPLAPEETDRYASFATAPGRNLFEHCERALDRGDRLGEHGLPLMGSGDWNDGMDRVGDKGKGESVWLAWFLIAAIEGFVELSGRMNRTDLQEKWRARSAALAAAADRAGWDGDWYLRAYDDDGRAWGSAAENECRIDSIAQSWAVLSGAAPAERASRAVASALHHLVREDDDIIRLLDPPFDRTPREPGYIKAYPPGVRENGGQYTHAAAWLAMAVARLGDGEGAKALFDRINPIRHALTPEAAEAFRVEPYVLAGDVSSNEAFVGRGGWTWYTGAAVWTWKLAVEEIIGVRLVEGAVQIAPCLPRGWDRAEVTLRRDAGTIALTLRNPHGLSTGRVVLTVNGAPWTAASIPFPELGQTCQVDAELVPGPPAGQDVRAPARGNASPQPEAATVIDPGGELSGDGHGSPDGQG